MKIEDLTLEHLQRLEVRDYELNDLGDNYLKENAPIFLDSEFKKAAITNKGEVSFIFGGKKKSDLAAWVWLVGSSFINESPRAAMMAIVKGQVTGAKMLGVKYLYTFNDPAYPFAIKFLKRLRFNEVEMIECRDGRERLLLVKEI